MNRSLMTNCHPFFLGGVHMQRKLMADNRLSLCKSANLLLRSGLIIPSSTGMFHMSPILVRSLEKLLKTIDKKMNMFNCQKVMLSHLAPKNLFDQSKRWEGFGDELIKTTVGGVAHCLCPTHEEAVSTIIQSYQKQLSYLHCPMRIYQTTHKFRNEQSPQHGLLRCREFIMNDLYTLDVDKTAAMKTYEDVSRMYAELFSQLGIQVVKVQACTGAIGGHLSHEYHILSEVGEDELVVDELTGEAYNAEYLVETKKTPSENLNKYQGIEVGHTFLLGTKYSDAFDLTFTGRDGRKSKFEMGCFGLGVTRIIGACLEALSFNNEMRWPMALSPYKVCIILPKNGSNESIPASILAETIFSSLSELTEFENDIIVDDRPGKTIGWKLNYAKLMGFPVVLILGKQITCSVNPQVEVIFQSSESETKMVSPNDVRECVQKYVHSKSMSTNKL